MVVQFVLCMRTVSSAFIYWCFIWCVSKKVIHVFYFSESRNLGRSKRLAINKETVDQTVVEMGCDGLN